MQYCVTSHPVMGHCIMSHYIKSRCVISRFIIMIYYNESEMSHCVMNHSLLQKWDDACLMWEPYRTAEG